MDGDKRLLGTLLKVFRKQVEAENGGQINGITGMRRPRSFLTYSVIQTRRRRRNAVPSLPNLKFKKRLIRMIMTPSEVVLLLIAIHLAKVAILLMTFPKVSPVGTIFLVVIDVIVVALTVVVALIMVVVGCCKGSK